MTKETPLSEKIKKEIENIELKLESIREKSLKQGGKIGELIFKNLSATDYHIYNNLQSEQDKLKGKLEILEDVAQCFKAIEEEMEEKSHAQKNKQGIVIGHFLTLGEAKEIIKKHAGEFE